MVGDLLKIETSQARDSGPRIRVTGAWQQGDRVEPTAASFRGRIPGFGRRGSPGHR
jgi:hypothetical protein